MSYVDDRETFFNRDDTEMIRALTERSVHQANAATQITPGDFETITGYTRHRTDEDTAMSHGMTAQYLNECVHKHIGLAVVDRESDTWGWVHDQHKNESGWVIGDTHDDRIQELRDGAHIKPALPAEYEKYEFLEETDPTETTYAKHPAPTADDSDDDWSDCEPITGGITITGDQSPYLDPTYYTDHAHIQVNDPVNPGHYQGFSNGAEVIDITENLTFSAGNAVKYLSRAGRIDGQNKGAVLEDLRKAAWYVAREIARIEAQK